MTNFSHDLIHSVRSKETWQVRSEQMAIAYFLLNGNIIYGKSTGALSDADLVKSTAMLQKIVLEVAPRNSTYYLMFETERRQLFRRSRRFYIESIKTIYSAHPFGMYILLHPHRFFRTVLNFTRPLLPFPAVVVTGMDEALQVIAEQEKLPEAPTNIRPVMDLSQFQGEHRQIFDELMEYLSSLDWLTEGSPPEGEKPGSHPFKPVYDVINLVKKDVDSLIREQETAKEALARSENRFHDIIEEIEDGYYECDLAGCITFANSALCDIYGYSLEELVGLPYQECLDEANARKIFPVFTNLYKTGRPVKKIEYNIIRKNGTSCSVEVSASVMKDANEETIGFRGIVRDVSESRQLKEQLKESEKKYRLLFNYADDAIFVIQDDRIKFPNYRSRQMFGYNEDDVVDIRFMDLIHPDDRKMVVDRYLRRLQGEKVVTPYSFRVYTKHGQVVWVQINAARLEWEGRPAVLVFLRDVTLQKNMEIQLRQSHKMEAIGTLAGGIAHDFNNILASIMGYTEVVLAEMPPSSRAYRNLEQIRRTILRAKEIVRQILTFSRPVNDDRPQPVQVGAIVREVVSMLERTLPAHIRITQSLDCKEDRVMATTAQLHEVFMNLCTNAIHAMSESGGELHLSMAAVKLNPEFVSQYAEAEPGRYLRVMIQDTGCGLSSEQKEHIFEPYFTTKPHGKGTGMGLAVVHSIVTANGGIITVDSREGEGSTFSVFFRLVEETVRPDSPAFTKAEALPEGSEHLLFVDDKKQLCEIGKNLLEHLGYSVVTATSAEQALNIVTRQPEGFDLVLTDLVMPGMTGDHLARELYRMQPGLPVIIFAGHDEQDLAVDTANTAVSEFLAKPYIVADVAVAVRRALERRRPVAAS